MFFIILVFFSSTLSYLHKNSADCHYISARFATNPNSAIGSLRCMRILHAEFDFAHLVSFEVAIRQRSEKSKVCVSFETRSKITQNSPHCHLII